MCECDPRPCVLGQHRAVYAPHRLCLDLGPGEQDCVRHCQLASRACVMGSGVSSARVCTTVCLTAQQGRLPRFGTTDIWGRISLCGGTPWAPRAVEQQPWPPPTRCQCANPLQVSGDNQKCLQTLPSVCVSPRASECVAARMYAWAPVCLVGVGRTSAAVCVPGGLTASLHARTVCFSLSVGLNTPLRLTVAVSVSVLCVSQHAIVWPCVPVGLHP